VAQAKPAAFGREVDYRPKAHGFDSAGAALRTTMGHSGSSPSSRELRQFASWLSGGLIAVPQFSAQAHAGLFRSVRFAPLAMGGASRVSI
jgi:hypothetical protein